MMLQECYKIQCIQVVGSFLRGNSNLTNGNLTPTIIPGVRPHEGLSIGGGPLGFHDTLVRIALSCDVPRKQRVVKCFLGGI